MSLQAEVVAEVRAGGPITFARYMELCLYHPRYGYYRGSHNSGREKFGAAGDFYTSSQVHPGFARLLVRRWVAMWESLGSGEFTLLEVGAGRGEIAREARAWAARAYPNFSRALRYLPLEYGDPLPPPVSGCIFSNEFFDSQPAHVLSFGGGRLREFYVAERDGRLCSQEGEPSSPGLESWLNRLGIEPAEGQVLELSLAAADWMRRFSALLERGYVLSFDYGYRAREINRGMRFPNGSLMTYRKHMATGEVFRQPGERDITAHVNFDLLREAGREAGLHETRFCTQGSYLMDLGEAGRFTEVFADCATEDDRLKTTLLLKNLLFGLGETIQVLEQTRSWSRNEPLDEAPSTTSVSER